MKVVLVLIIIGGFTYLGYSISKYYKARKVFFQNLILFLGSLECEIVFSQDKLLSIFDKAKDNYCKSLKQLLDNYLKYLRDNTLELSKELLFHNITILKSDEKEVVYLMFNSFGRHEAMLEKEKIDSFKNSIISFGSASEKENLKYGSMSIKISILIGCVVSLVLV